MGLVRAGYKTLVSDLPRIEGNHLANSPQANIAPIGAGNELVAGDITCLELYEAMIVRALARWRHIGCLVRNAAARLMRRFNDREHVIEVIG